MYTYTYIYTCTYTCIHAHTYTYANICTRMHRYKILVTTPQRVKQYHRRTYTSICICMHIHTYIRIHICAQPVASVFTDVYVGVKTHLCNVHTYPCTSAQNTCKVHATLTAKEMHIYIYLHTYAYAYICTRKSRYTTRKRALKSNRLSETPIVWRNTSDTYTERIRIQSCLVRISKVVLS